MRELESKTGGDSKVRVQNYNLDGSVYIIYLSSQERMFKEFEKQNPSQKLEPQQNIDRFIRSAAIHPTFRPSGRLSGDVSILSYADPTPLTTMKITDEKQFSVRSMRTTKNRSKSPLRLQASTQVPNEAEFHSSPVGGAEIYQYANLERILKNENDNLKMQNQLLLKEVYKLKQNNHKYKEEYKKSNIEVEGLKLECEAQKRRADEMKEIIMNRLMQLEGKINVGDQSENLGLSECESILEALTLSESGMK